MSQFDVGKCGGNVYNNEQMTIAGMESPLNSHGVTMATNTVTHGNHNLCVPVSAETTVLQVNDAAAKIVKSVASSVQHNIYPSQTVTMTTMGENFPNVPNGGHQRDAMKMNGVTMMMDNLSDVKDEKPMLKMPPGGAPKDITIEELEFDGNTVLCRVCGDKASGFHYGVHACEGCKGFFRRSIQQKIQYRPCLKNQMCNIMRVNRNRCQYCRLRKCIAVGMSRDAVRFGRVPKREKAKILEQMQKVNAQLQGNLLNDALDNPVDVVQRIITAHMQCCELTHSRFASLFKDAQENPQFVDCPAHMACPLNPSPDQCDGIQKWDEFSNYFTPAIRNVVNFAKSIPGFQVFSQDDQVTLLKAGTFEVLLVHLACLFDSQASTMMFTNGKLYRKPPQHGNSSAGFLLDSMFDFADRLNQLRLTDKEVALFSAMVVVAPDRPGLRYHDQVQRVHTLVSQELQITMKMEHPNEPAAYSKLLMKIPDLRTLNTLHSEKLLGLTVPQNTNSHVVESKPVVSHSSVSAADQDLMTQSKPASCPMSSLPMPGFHPQERMETPPLFPPTFPAGVLRCPVSTSEVTNGCIPSVPYIAGDRPPGPPIVAHHVSLDSQEKELILQTPLGAFHRYAPPYVQFGSGLPAMIKMEAEMKAKASKNSDNFVKSGIKSPERSTFNKNLISDQVQGAVFCSNTGNHETDSTKTQNRRCSSPEDFIDVDLHVRKPVSQSEDYGPSVLKNYPFNKADMRRAMAEPMIPDLFRKRLLENMDCEVDPKIARLWDYEMRSSRSNSMSSSSSMESTDSAYRTISNPGTPRSGYDLARSPYASPAEMRMNCHVVSMMKPNEDRHDARGFDSRAKSSNDNHEGVINTQVTETYLPTLRNMLIGAHVNGAHKSKPTSPLALERRKETTDTESTELCSTLSTADGTNPGRQSGASENDYESHSAVQDEHYWMHKKLKLKQSLTEHSETAPIRERAASFSTVVSQMRQRLAPPMLKPVSREAPPRLAPNSPPPTFAAIVSKVMEATLTAETLRSQNFVPYVPESIEKSQSGGASTKSCDAYKVEHSSRNVTVTSPVPTTTSSANSVSTINTMLSSPVVDQTLSAMSNNKPTHTRPSVDDSVDNRRQPTPLGTDASQVEPLTIVHPSSKSSNDLATGGRLTVSNNPSQRHPELLSRLTASPKVNANLLMCSSKVAAGNRDACIDVTRDGSRTPPPRLYPINDATRSGAPYSEKQSPPPLYPIGHQQACSSKSPKTDCVSDRSSPSSASHLNAISTLKDKILKRIDSQENIARMSPHQPIWNSSGSPIQYAPMPESRKRPHDARDSPKPRMTPPTNAPPRQAPPSFPPNMNGTLPMGIPNGMFPPGRMPTNLHPALLYNAAVHQFQALQHLHSQAAHIQLQMQQLSSMANVNSVCLPNQEQAAIIDLASKEKSHEAVAHSTPGVGGHSNHTGFFANGNMEPMNLTKQTLPMAAIKSEPL